jgi:serine/threonine protein kinase
MYRYCERCERVTLDGNLWCQDKECPAEEGYPIFGYGEVLGDLKVTKLVRVWRTAALYQAERDGQPLLLKIAHPGDEHAERLRREAAVLQSLSPRQSGLSAFIRSFLPASRPRYPIVLSPYPRQSKRPYGEITYLGEPRVYSVYQYAEGKILSDLLLETPQVWHTQAAWMVAEVARALRPLAARQKCHLCLTPDHIMVELDSQGVYRPMLLDLGFIVDPGEAPGLYDWSKVCEPAYTAPELLAAPHDSAHTPAADVYSLGMIFYEMLAGHPGYETKLLRDEQVREEILHIRKPLSVGRPELEQTGVASVLERAVAPTGRYSDVIEFSKALAKIYSPPPPERKKIPRRLYALLITAGLVLLVLAGIAGITLLQVLTSAP